MHHTPMWPSRTAAIHQRRQRHDDLAMAIVGVLAAAAATFSAAVLPARTSPPGLLPLSRPWLSAGATDGTRQRHAILATSFLNALSRFAGVLSYDRRGYGQSAALRPEPVTAKAAATGLRQLLDSLHISQPVVLVGHSLGGLYAQHFVRHFPQQVVGVVLLDTASPFEPLADPRFQTRATLAPGSTDYRENSGVDTSILQTRRSPPFPPIPLVVLTATDHRSPPTFEQEWRQIQAQTAAQSPLGRHRSAPASPSQIGFKMAISRDGSRHSHNWQRGRRRAPKNGWLKATSSAPVRSSFMPAIPTAPLSITPAVARGGIANWACCPVPASLKP